PMISIGVMISSKIKIAKMEAPIGSPSVLMETVVVLTYFNNKLKIIWAEEGKIASNAKTIQSFVVYPMSGTLPNRLIMSIVTPAMKNTRKLYIQWFTDFTFRCPISK